jgi:hypothetical protein
VNGADGLRDKVPHDRIDLLHEGVEQSVIALRLGHREL